MRTHRFGFIALLIVMTAVSAGCASMYEGGYLKGFNSPPQLQQTLYPVVVDYDRSINELVAAGDYFRPDERRISVSIPASSQQGKAVVQVHVIRLKNKTETTEQAVRELNQLGFRPTTLKEFLAFAAAYPHVQEQVLVGDLETFQNNEGRPCRFVLHFIGRARGLMCWPGDDWNAGNYVLAIRK